MRAQTMSAGSYRGNVQRSPRERAPRGNAMSMTRPASGIDLLPEELKRLLRRRAAEIIGLGFIAVSAILLVALASWSAEDPSFSRSSAADPANLLGRPGAVIADLLMQLFGVAALAAVLPLLMWGWLILTHRRPRREKLRLGAYVLGVIFAAGFAACLPRLSGWPLPSGLGGVLGEGVLSIPLAFRNNWLIALDYLITGTVCLAGALAALPVAVGFGFNAVPEEEPEIDEDAPVYEDDDEPRGGLSLGALAHGLLALKAQLWTARGKAREPGREKGRRDGGDPRGVRLRRGGRPGRPRSRQPGRAALRQQCDAAPRGRAGLSRRTPRTRTTKTRSRRRRRRPVPPRAASARRCAPSRAAGWKPRRPAGAISTRPSTCSPSRRRSRDRRCRTTCCRRMPATSKACWTISACAAPSPMRAPAPWSRSMSWSRRRASSRPA